MKKHLKILLLFCCFTATRLFAQQQDITGMWNGEILLTDSAGELVHLPYEMAITEEKGKLGGYSRIVFHANGKDEAGIRDIVVKWKGNDIIIEDEEFLEHQFSIKTPRRVRKIMVMQLTVTDKEMIMEGTWETNKVRGYIPAKGTSVLKRKNDFKKSELFKRLDTLNLSAKLSFKDRPSIEDGGATVAAAPKPAPEPEKKPAPPPAAVKEPEPEPELIIPAIDKTTAELIALNTKPWPSRTRITALPRQKKIQMDALAKSNLKPAPPKPTPVATKPEPPVVAAVPKPEKKQPARKGPDEDEPVVAKTPEKKTEPVAAKPAPPTIAYVAPSAKGGAAEIDKRITKSDQAYYFESDSLVLTLYDNGEVDGDTVTVLMNGGIIFSKAGLSTKANTKTVYITPAMDSVKLVMYAESLGEIPPNTGLLIVNDGDKRYDVRFSADLTTNAAIVLRRKKNE